jgi:hypothetical protein
VNNPVLQGDQWLQSYLPTVLSSSWYASGGVVVLTWDEGTTSQGWNGGSGAEIPTLVISARAHGAYAGGGDHYGTLRAIEEAHGVDPRFVNGVFQTFLRRLPTPPVSPSGPVRSSRGCGTRRSSPRSSAPTSTCSTR